MKIAIVQGHPDPAGGHFGHALADAYAQAAREAGHEVRVIEVARLELPLLRTQKDWQDGKAPAALRPAQDAIAWAGHLVIFFPLWLGDMPALLKAFFEQALRPGFAFSQARSGQMAKKLLQGRSARIVVTMGMPSFFYRIYYRSHSVKNLKRNILEFCGFGPVRTTLIGMVEGKPASRETWLDRMRALGRSAR